MSHVAEFATEPGKPLIADLEAVKLACLNLGLEYRLDNKYKWYNTHVGDYPVPGGWKVSDMGKNATAVVSVSKEKAAELGIDLDKCYELGIVEDKLNPGAFTLMYDFFAGGYGLDKVIGSPIYGERVAGQRERPIKALAPTFMQHYRMCCDALAAKETGDSIKFEEMSDGSWVSYTQPNLERLAEHA
jgi:hypothetical protein